MKRPTWHKVRLWRFCSQSVWTGNIFYTFLPSNKENWTKKCGENDWAKKWIAILSDDQTERQSRVIRGRVGLTWPHGARSTVRSQHDTVRWSATTGNCGTVYNYQLPAFFANYSWQKLPVLLSLMAWEREFLQNVVCLFSSQFTIRFDNVNTLYRSAVSIIICTLFTTFQTWWYHFLFTFLTLWTLLKYQRFLQPEKGVPLW